jgi:glycosyltransferase involved in cell wall biosynthesis
VKILHIIPTLRKGGAERLVLDICNQLYSTPNVEIKLICFSDKNEYPDLAVADYIKVIPSSVSLSFAGKNILQIDELREELNSFQPDIIHTHLFEAEIVSRSCYYPKAKWFSHCHDNMKQFENLRLSTFTKKTKLTNYHEKRYLIARYKTNGGNNFITISNNSKQYISQTMSEFPVHLFHNAIDYNKFNSPNQKNTSFAKLNLINVGSLSTNKNQEFLIRVATILKSKKIDFDMVFAGDGIIRRELEILVEQSQLKSDITFLGSINNVENYLWQSDIYLHSAKSEAFGLTLIEAMVSGLPVVTLDGTGNRDIIEQDKNGYMIYEQNAELFAQTIIDLWNDKQKYREMSEYAQEYAKQYDIKPYVEKLLVLYQNAIDEKK